MKSDLNAHDPRVKRTRQLLLDALCELASERDFRSVTVQEIAERATLNRATFYAHFRDKDDLMDAAFRCRLRDALESELTGAAFTTENLRRLFIVACNFMDTFVRRCPRTPGQNNVLVKPAVQEELYAYILQWLSSELPRTSSTRFPSESIAALLSWSIFGASIEWCRGHAESQQVAANRVVDLISEGLFRAMPSALKE